MSILHPYANETYREEHLTEPDSTAFGVEGYDCRMRIWESCTWRNIQMHGSNSMSLQSPNQQRTRVAFLLENRAAHAQFRSTPTAPARQHDLLHNICLVPAGDSVWAHSDRGGHLELSSLAFDAQELSLLLGEAGSCDVLSRPQLNFSNERIWYYARLLAQESRAPQAFSTLYCEGLLLALLIEVVRLDPEFTLQPTRGGLSQRQLKLAVEFIEQNLATRISLTDLAALTGLSLSHFSHAFKTSTGMPPHRWQLQARVRRAQELLVSSLHPVPLSLSEVATQTGFADQAHFTRVFRRVTGMTPRAWRREKL